MASPSPSPHPHPHPSATALHSANSSSRPSSSTSPLTFSSTSEFNGWASAVLRRSHKGVVIERKSNPLQKSEKSSASGGTKCPFFMQAALSSVGEWVMFQDIRVHNEACLLKMETAATTETATASASSLLKLKKGKPLSKIASRIAGPASREGRIIPARPKSTLGQTSSHSPYSLPHSSPPSSSACPTQFTPGNGEGALLEAPQLARIPRRLSFSSSSSRSSGRSSSFSHMHSWSTASSSSSRIVGLELGSSPPVHAPALAVSPSTPWTRSKEASFTQELDGALGLAMLSSTHRRE
ncbi:MAG: hypothetical protein CYPHOPRED_002665 [Cyphobasidiales sp. Tagirdzhanova-0007]|nr:MAG: hypothetical protein CYPHOPRED_002665 [Cyphobasidiales sp. Tagirdzhanova-0007]